MPPTPILYPVFALVALTFSVLLLIPIVRIRASFAGTVTASDFTLGESDRVPDKTRIPNRNYMNLLEMPVLFYVACIASYVTNTVNDTVLILAWSYVALRVLHSLIHLTYNHVIQRLVVFATSNFVLTGLWLVLFFSL